MPIQIASCNIIHHSVLRGPSPAPNFQMLQRGIQLCPSPSNKSKDWASFKALRLRKVFGTLYAQVFKVWEDIGMPGLRGAPLIPLQIIEHPVCPYRPVFCRWLGSQALKEVLPGG